VWSQTISISTLRRVIGNSKGEEGKSQGSKLLKERLVQNRNFQGDEEVQTKKNLHGRGMDIFWNSTFNRCF